MSHLGIIAPPVSSHIYLFSALGRTLQKRGHRVTLFQMVDVESKARSEGLEFHALGASDHALGSLPESLNRLSRLKGLAALRFTVRAIERTTEMICRDGPQAIKKCGIDLLLVDQTEPAGGSVADFLGLPFVTVCSALAINRESGIPPPFTGWRYDLAGWARFRNILGYLAWDQITKPIRKVLDHYRRQWALPVHENPDDSFSKLAQISQQIREFDFPRRELPSFFHYVGPLRDDTPQVIPFPWDQLNGKPLIYASLGTLQNRAAALFGCIAEGCRELPVQLLINHVGGLNKEEISRFPGSPLVVPFAPQRAVLARTRLTITHGGLNTVLDSLIHGVPMVAIPLAFEQPANAARITWTGVGETLPFARLTPAMISRTVQQVMKSETYRTRAKRMADSIRQSGGVERAADIVEEVLRTGKPVLTDANA